MAELLTQNAECQEHRQAALKNHRSSVRSLQHSFKYYIHDSVTSLRFELIGDLRASDVTELAGTWETARTTLVGRRLVLDLCRLFSADDEGRRWLLKMRDAGAAPVPANYFEQDPEARAQAPLAGGDVCVKLRLLSRVLERFGARPER